MDIQFSHLPVKRRLLTVLALLVKSPALGKKSVPTQGCQSVMGENLSYLVSALWATILPSYHMSGAKSPPKGSGTSEDNLLRMTRMWQVHTSLVYTCSNEWQLLNNNLLILLKPRGTCPGGECLPTQTLRWSLENALRSLPYHGLKGTLQKHGLFPLLLPTNVPLAS